MAKSQQTMLIPAYLLLQLTLQVKADDAVAVPIEWTSQLVCEGGRIDALADLGEGVVIAGSRFPRPGFIYVSRDAGATWTDLARLLGDEPLASSVTCMAGDGDGAAYLLTGDAHVWRSDDRGETWTSLVRVSDNPRLGAYQHSYGLVVLPSGTLLVSDTNPTGGHVFRSTDRGESWTDLGAVSSQAVYRFERVGDGVLLNGWAGHVYKSTDDGRSWTDGRELTDSALYATASLGDGVALQAAENGLVFRSTDNGDTWNEVARFDDAADDFVSLGDGIVLYSTYTGERNVYLSLDAGLNWSIAGPLTNTVDGDVLDHVIAVEYEGRPYAIGGTTHGYIVRWTPAQ
jgi:photosystem II stability/assembly factor-like uncharacterized protein